MEKHTKRCLVIICCLICLLPLTTQVALAITDVSVDDEPWDYVCIYANDEIVVPNVVIIYLHGHNNSGYSIDSLQNLAKVDHPLKYAREGTLPLPDDTIFICPQNHYDAEFNIKQKELSNFIHDIALKYPDALIILAGHSSGSLAAYSIASSDNEDVDAYVFIAGIKPGKERQLTNSTNCLVAYGNEKWLASRGGYSALFSDVDISDKKFAQECSYLEEDRNNGYIRGPWRHGNAPLVFLEDFFWEWLNNISYN